MTDVQQIENSKVTPCVLVQASVVRETETEGSTFQGHLRLQSELKDSLDYLRPNLKTNT